MVPTGAVARPISRPLLVHARCFASVGAWSSRPSDLHDLPRRKLANGCGRSREPCQGGGGGFESRRPLQAKRQVRRAFSPRATPSFSGLSEIPSLSRLSL